MEQRIYRPLTRPHHSSSSGSALPHHGQQQVLSFSLSRCKLPYLNAARAISMITRMPHWESLTALGPMRGHGSGEHSAVVGTTIFKLTNANNADPRPVSARRQKLKQ